MIQRGRLTVEYGQKIKTWGGWYRHDTYFLDGVKLEGSVQTKTNGRGGYDVHTGIGGYGVRGRDLSWLLRQNGYTDDSGIA